jgi:hypothetical protein
LCRCDGDDALAGAVFAAFEVGDQLDAAIQRHDLADRGVQLAGHGERGDLVEDAVGGGELKILCRLVIAARRNISGAQARIGLARTALRAAVRSAATDDEKAAVRPSAKVLRRG